MVALVHKSLWPATFGAGPGATTNPWMQQPSPPQPNRPTPNPHHTPQQHPADRYRPQLQSLRDMGFDNEQQCLQVLQQYHGNLNRAVDVLIMTPPTPVPVAPVPAPVAAPTATPPAAAASSSSPQQHDTDEPLPDPKEAQDKKDD